ncbi:MAG: BNR-4 repeat-containing protein [Candidatus Latescibacteria bacterium]|nr:BNR-4 repeat-containing protein [Candidatus Latescibacterota bacterium]
MAKQSFQKIKSIHIIILAIIAALFIFLGCECKNTGKTPSVTVSKKADGYHGIWHADMESDDEYRYIYYSGGMATYTAKHIPMAYYAQKVNKTFFCYGGTMGKENNLYQMVSYYDHTTGTVPRPTVLIDKQTSDAHDNPTIMLDDNGYIWVFVSAHGTVRSAYIYKSTEPYSIDSFSLINTTNFSYPQPWYIKGKGFLFLHTRYIEGRNLYWQTSPIGKEWSEPFKLATIGQGHYQVSWRHGNKVGTAFNYHPDLNIEGNWKDPENPGKNPALSGANNRTNLYYIETTDFGETWTNAAGTPVAVPLIEPENAALVRNYRKENLLVYMKDINFDADGNPVILYITGKGSESGPQHDPRTWTTAYWTGSAWRINPVTTSDNNYDMGSLYIEKDDFWRIIGPTETGPQPYNCGGEIAFWTSKDKGVTWEKSRQVTHNSRYNHSYVRRPVNAHPDFYAFWADGNGRGLSSSRLYMCDKTGTKVFMFPEKMRGKKEKLIQK